MVPKSEFRKINMKICTLDKQWHLKMLYLKSKFRQFGNKIKISSDVLKNVYTSQFQGAGYESYWFWFQQKFTINIIPL